MPDYAVARYAKLYDLGVGDADMELTVLRIKRSRQLHAVLVVRHQGRVCTLDNLRRDVQGPERMREFEVVYFINRGGGVSDSFSCPTDPSVDVFAFDLSIE